VIDETAYRGSALGGVVWIALGGCVFFFSDTSFCSCNSLAWVHGYRDSYALLSRLEEFGGRA
jgi:hypothetical protein